MRWLNPNIPLMEHEIWNELKRPFPNSIQLRHLSSPCILFDVRKAHQPIMPFWRQIKYMETYGGRASLGLSLLPLKIHFFLTHSRRMTSYLVMHVLSFPAEFFYVFVPKFRIYLGVSSSFVFWIYAPISSFS
jgi:hypothetical protein